MLREALNVYYGAAVEVDVRAAVARTKYKLSMLLNEAGSPEEAHLLRAEAGRLRQSLFGIDLVD